MATWQPSICRQSWKVPELIPVASREDISAISPAALPEEISLHLHPAKDTAMLEIIRQNTVIMAALKSRLDKPIESKVALHGRGGLYDAMDEDAQLKNNANL